MRPQAVSTISSTFVLLVDPGRAGVATDLKPLMEHAAVRGTVELPFMGHR